MLPQRSRIQRKYLPSILKTRKRFHSLHFLLYISVMKDAQPSRFSFSVSKKVFKRAVDRNKYRRRGYGVISRNIKSIKPGFFYFFSFKKIDKKILFSDLEKEIINLLDKAGVLV